MLVIVVIFGNGFYPKKTENRTSEKGDNQWSPPLKMNVLVFLNFMSFLMFGSIEFHIGSNEFCIGGLFGIHHEMAYYFAYYAK